MNGFLKLVLAASAGLALAACQSTHEAEDAPATQPSVETQTVVYDVTGMT